jgi:hypothetical protein
VTADQPYVDGVQMTSVTDPTPPASPPIGPVHGPVQGPEVPVFVAPPPGLLTLLLERWWRSSPVWVAPAALLACMGAAAGYTVAVDPTVVAADAAPSCLLKYATGFVCPGCGGTRAAWYLLHADLPAAARHHAVFVFVLPFLLYLYVAWAGRRVFGWQLPELRISPAVIAGFLGVWAVWSVLRNLPWAPFTMLYV